MKFKDLTEHLANMHSETTFYSSRVYFVAGQIKRDYFDCIALCDTKGIDQKAEIFVQQNAVYNSLFLQSINTSPFAIVESIRSVVSDIYKDFDEFPAVIETKDGNRFNYWFSNQNYFINLPNGYVMNDLIRTIPLKIAVNNTLETLDKVDVDKIYFYKNKDFVCVPIMNPSDPNIGYLMEFTPPT